MYYDVKNLHLVRLMSTDLQLFEMLFTVSAAILDAMLGVHGKLVI